MVDLASGTCGMSDLILRDRNEHLPAVAAAVSAIARWNSDMVTWWTVGALVARDPLYSACYFWYFGVWMHGETKSRNGVFVTYMILKMWHTPSTVQAMSCRELLCPSSSVPSPSADTVPRPGQWPRTESQRNRKNRTWHAHVSCRGRTEQSDVS